MKNTNIQTNLLYLMRGQIWTPTELARRSGVNQPTVKRILDGESKDPKRANLEKLAKAFNVSVDSLFQSNPNYPSPSARTMGIKKRTTSPQSVKEQNSRYNVEKIGLDTKRYVPLISWIQAGAWQQAEDHSHPGQAEEYLPCPVNHSVNTYALRVKGDSMTAPHGRSYPESAIIYVDPAMAGDVTTGDRVIAKIKGDDAVTFKVYIEDGGKKFLKGLNPSYPILTDKFRILGKIIGMWVPE